MLMFSINTFIPTDYYIINQAKQIRDAYTLQYNEKRFVLWFTLFTYLVTTKVAWFELITVYNTNFQIRAYKLSISGENQSTNLTLAAYFHRIKTIDLNFATTQKPLAQTKILKMSKVMAKLKNKKKQARIVEITALLL